MSRNIEFSVGEFYHIYNRGTEKRKIFNSKVDYLRFLIYLYLCNQREPVHVYNLKNKSFSEILELERGKNLVAIGAYCLMPNHFHLLAKEITENGISIFIQKLSTAYTMYFNKKNERTGSLFQSKFKAHQVDNDEYLNYLFAYIHLNPIKLVEPKWKEVGVLNRMTVVNFLSSYEFSSYSDYCEKVRDQKAILNKEAFPEYFEKSTDFKELMRFWLEFGSDSSEVEPR